jgi:hypothetical protein
MLTIAAQLLSVHPQANYAQANYAIALAQGGDK